MMRGPVPLPRRLRRLLNTPLLALAVLAVLVDDAFRAFVIPAVRAFARLAPIRWIETRIAGMPPHAILLLFVIPLAIIEPFKIYAFYLFGRGEFLAGVLMFVLAKVVGLGLAERLFAIGRNKLLSIRWFAWCHAMILAIRDHAHMWLQRQKFWQRALRVARAARRALARIRLGLIRFVEQSRRGRFAAARRRVRRYRNA